MIQNLDFLLDDPEVLVAEADLRRVVRRAIAKRRAKPLRLSGPDNSAHVVAAEKALNSFFAKFLDKQGKKIVAQVGRKLRAV